MGIGWDFPDYAQTKKKEGGNGGVGGIEDFSTYPILHGCVLLLCQSPLLKITH